MHNKIEDAKDYIRETTLDALYWVVQTLDNSGPFDPNTFAQIEEPYIRPAPRRWAFHCAWAIYQFVGNRLFV